MWVKQASKQDRTPSDRLSVDYITWEIIYDIQWHLTVEAEVYLILKISCCRFGERQLWASPRQQSPPRVYSGVSCQRSAAAP